MRLSYFYTVVFKFHTFSHDILDKLELSHMQFLYSVADGYNIFLHFQRNVLGCKVVTTVDVQQAIKESIYSKK